MAKSLNQVTLLGALTRDPELRQTPNGQSVCTISLALNRSYKNQNDEWVEATDYIDVVAWAKLAENINTYLQKGRRCLVVGRLQSRSWEQDGQKRSKVEVLANDVTFLDSAKDTQQQVPQPQEQSDDKFDAFSQKHQSNDDEPINLSDIPF